jgi:hypothetical protein
VSNPTFEGMAECIMCDSGTFEPVEFFYSKTGYVTYCKACWLVIKNDLNHSPVDNPVDNTPIQASNSVDN